MLSKHISTIVENGETTMDQQNSLRQRIDGGGVALGASADSFAPTLVELYGELGLDFLGFTF